MIDPVPWAEAGRHMQGPLATAALPRLRQALHCDEIPGEVTVDLQGGVGEGGVRFIRGHIDGALRVPCQRCLQDMTLEVHSDVALGLVRSQRDADLLPPPYEALVVDGRAVPVARIVEDELLMAVPIVVMHDEPGCGPQSGAGAGEETHAEEDVKPNPFAVLKRLKK